MDTCRYQVSWTTSQLSCRGTINYGYGSTRRSSTQPNGNLTRLSGVFFSFSKERRRLTQFTRSCLWSYPRGTHTAILYWLSLTLLKSELTRVDLRSLVPFSSSIFTTSILGYVLIVCFMNNNNYYY